MRKGNLGLLAGLGCLGVVVLLGVALFAGTSILRQMTLLPNTGPGFTVPEGQSPLEPQPTLARIEGTPTQISPATPQPVPTETALAPDFRMVPFGLNLIYEQVNPGVVSIEVQSSTGLGEGGASVGSGFILDEQGHIVTNHHVLANAQTVNVVFFNGISVRAEVIGNDPDSDLAVLQVEGLIPEVHSLPLGDSDEVLVGESVVALGNPFNLANTMTFGIVSAVGRVIPSGFTRYSIPQAIQTDAAINPGNSGGPLINMRGEVIGVNAQIRTNGGIPGNVGIGFAIPANIVKMVAPALIEQGTYQWPYLGVSGIPLSPSLALANNLPQETRGAYINEVVQGGPANQAGMQGTQTQEMFEGVAVPVGGDVILSANGQTVNNFNDLLNIIAFRQPGEELAMVVLRDGEQIEVTATLAPRPSNSQPVP